MLKEVLYYYCDYYREVLLGRSMAQRFTVIQKKVYAKAVTWDPKTVNLFYKLAAFTCSHSNFHYSSCSNVKKTEFVISTNISCLGFKFRVIECRLIKCTKIRIIKSSPTLFWLIVEQASFSIIHDPCRESMQTAIRIRRVTLSLNYYAHASESYNFN